MKIANDADYTKLALPVLIGPRFDLALVTVGDGRFQLILCTCLEKTAEGFLVPTGSTVAWQAEASPAIETAPPRAKRSHLTVVSQS